MVRRRLGGIVQKGIDICTRALRNIAALVSDKPTVHEEAIGSRFAPREWVAAVPYTASFRPHAGHYPSAPWAYSCSNPRAWKCICAVVPAPYVCFSTSCLTSSRPSIHRLWTHLEAGARALVRPAPAWKLWPRGLPHAYFALLVRRCWAVVA